MPATDAQRWNRRYQEEQHAGFERPRAFLLAQAAWLPTHGLALDVAMGLGANAGWLLARGLNVIGVDISEIAARQAYARYPGLQAVIADLTAFSLPAHTFDVIVNFYYLQRDLWPQFVQALRPGGVLIFETLTQAVRQVRPDISPEFLLAPGELHQGFAGLDVQVYREAWIEAGCDSRRAVASMVATKPR